MSVRPVAGGQWGAAISLALPPGLAPRSMTQQLPRPTGKLARRDKSCKTGSHNCLGVGRGDACCDNGSYCYLDQTSSLRCCPIGIECADSPCSSDSFFCRATDSPSPDSAASSTPTTTRDGCCRRPCPQASHFLCPQSLGGKCCRYGAECRAGGDCVETAESSTVPVTLSAVATRGSGGTGRGGDNNGGSSSGACVAESQYLCADGTGCCSTGQRCTRLSGTAYCEATATATATLAAAARSGESGESGESGGGSQGLSLGARAAMGASIALAASFILAGSIWLCFFQRPRRHQDGTKTKSRHQRRHHHHHRGSGPSPSRSPAMGPDPGPTKPPSTGPQTTHNPGASHNATGRTSMATHSNYHHSHNNSYTSNDHENTTTYSAPPRSSRRLTDDSAGGNSPLVGPYTDSATLDELRMSLPALVRAGPSRPDGPSDIVAPVEIGPCWRLSGRAAGGATMRATTPVRQPTPGPFELYGSEAYPSPLPALSPSPDALERRGRRERGG